MALMDMFRKNKDKIVKSLTDDDKRKTIDDYKASDDFKKDAETYVETEMKSWLKDFITNDEVNVVTEEVEPSKDVEKVEDAPIVEVREKEEEKKDE